MKMAKYLKKYLKYLICPKNGKIFKKAPLYEALFIDNL